MSLFKQAISMALSLLGGTYSQSYILGGYYEFFQTSS